MGLRRSRGARTQGSVPRVGRPTDGQYCHRSRKSRLRTAENRGRAPAPLPSRLTNVRGRLPPTALRRTDLTIRWPSGDWRVICSCRRSKCCPATGSGRDPDRAEVSALVSQRAASGCIATARNLCALREFKKKNKKAVAGSTPCCAVGGHQCQHPSAIAESAQDDVVPWWPAVW